MGFARRSPACTSFPGAPALLKIDRQASLAPWIASVTPNRYAWYSLTVTPSIASRQAGATSSRNGTVARSAWISAIPRIIPGVAAVPRPMWNSCCAAPKSAITGWNSTSPAGRRPHGVCTKKS